MKTVLTGELASKRNRIAKSHNLRLLALFPLMTLFIIATAKALPRGFPHAFLVFIGGLIAIEGYGIYRIFQHDKQMCRDLGFLCPFCQKPLYEPHALISNSLCPKCGKDIAKDYAP